MYFSSPCRMRLAFGPGSAVLIFGPIVRVLVVMGSSGETVVGCRFSVLSAVFWRELLNGVKDLKLVAAEQAGTHLRWQHCQMTARAHQQVQPALGQMRIGIAE